jgi:hypothetical protein
LSNRPGHAADLHFRAANATVGFLDRTERATRLDLEAALRPARLHEAQWHLGEGSRIARRTGNASVAKFASANERLNRIGEPFGWTQLRWAERFSNQADTDLWAALRDHLAKWPNGMLVHPEELVLAAKFADKLYRRKLSVRAPTAEDSEIQAEKRRLLRRAWDACDAVARIEQNCARFMVATTRACLIMADAPNKTGLNLARRDNDTALTLLLCAKKILNPEWFEYMGDACWNHLDAAEFYR